MKALKAFIKPFEVPQRSMNIIFILIHFSERHGAGKVKCLSCTQPVLKFNDIKKEQKNLIT